MRKSIQQTFQVSYTFPVHFTTHCFLTKNPLLKNIISDTNGQFPKKILCLVDKGVAQNFPKLLKMIQSYHQYHQKFLNLVCSPITMKGGEACKNKPWNLQIIYQAIEKFGLCRHSYVLAVGGGAFLDMVGFAAATAHRGIRLIRLPTTVLAQNDSGVGVKNGINAFNKKNFIGSFNPPAAVINDTSFITSLSDRDWRSGIAEAIKVSILKDKPFFEFLERNATGLNKHSQKAMEELIYKCAKLHLEHIATSGDPYEMGSSRPLDFGHWAAHKLEQLTNYKLRHGEAVAAGMAIDITYSYLMGDLSKKSWLRILKLIKTFDLPIYHQKMSLHLSQKSSQSLLSGLEEFREHLGGQLTIILLKDIGSPIEVNHIDKNKMKDSIRLLEALDKRLKEEYGQTSDKVPSYPTAVN